MDTVLKSLKLEDLTEKFQTEHITPDIVCKLSAHEMEMLGINSRSDREAHTTIALVQWAAAPALHGTCVDGKRTNAHCACSDLVFIPPYNRVNFHGKLLVYYHTTGKTPVVI